nr:unnamed protein product [Callosobruchus chinensis]
MENARKEKVNTPNSNNNTDDTSSDMNIYKDINNKQMMYSQKLRELNYEIMSMEAELIAAYLKYAETANILKKTEDILKL